MDSLVRLCEGTIVASTRSRELERLYGEGEVVVIWVIHQEPAQRGVLKVCLCTLS